MTILSHSSILNTMKTQTFAEEIESLEHHDDISVVDTYETADSEVVEPINPERLTRAVGSVMQDDIMAAVNKAFVARDNIMETTKIVLDIFMTLYRVYETARESLENALDLGGDPGVIDVVNRSVSHNAAYSQAIKAIHAYKSVER